MRAAIPASLEEIDPELLSAAVAPRFPGARARSVEVVDAHSGTTGRARLRVAWEPGSDAPEALFAKLAPTDEIQRQMVITTGMGRREARFYDTLTDNVPVRTAASYATAWTDDGSGYWMLIEDLAASGCSFPSWRDPDQEGVAAGTLDTLARLHAGFWESPRLQEEFPWIERPMRSDFAPVLVQSGLEQFGDEMPAAFHELARIYVEHTEAVNDLMDEGPKTLIHGDAHLGNLFLDGAEVGLLDWACTCRAPGLRDVGYFLCNSIDAELRRDREHDLVRGYLEALAKAGAPAPSFDDAFMRYRRYALCAWVAATVTAAVGDRMQALEIGMRSMKRATRAIVELETVELVREGLGLRG